MTKRKNTIIHIYPAAVLMLLVIPLCNAVLHLVYSTVAGDVLLTVWANIISCVIYGLTTLSLYAGLGYAVLSRLRRLATWPYLVMYGVGLLFVYAGGVVADKLNMTDTAFAEMLPLTVTTTLLNIGIEAILFIVTILLADMFLRTHKCPTLPPKNPVKRNPTNTLALIPVAVCLVNSLIWAIASTVVDIVSVGLPINMTEVVYLLSPYLLTAGTAIVGYLVIWRVLSSRVITAGN